MSIDRIRPRFGQNVYIAEGTYVGGDVTMGDDSTVMYNVVIRGDLSPIRIGRRVNVQDGVVIHTQKGTPLDIGDEVTIGHRAVVHCRRVGAGALIGTGAIVLDGAEVGPGALVGAGAVVSPGAVIPAGKLALGIPARVVRDVGAEDRRYMDHAVNEYVALGRAHARGLYANAAGRGSPVRSGVTENERPV